MKKYNYIVSVIMIAIGAYIFYETSGYSTSGIGQKNPAIWPMLLAAALILLSVALIIETALQKTTEKQKKEIVIDWKGEGMKKVYLTFAIVIGFLILMNIVGMLIALLLLIPAVEWVMGCKDKKMLIILPIALVIFVYVFFVVVMKITLPQPFWA